MYSFAKKASFFVYMINFSHKFIGFLLASEITSWSFVQGIIKMARESVAFAQKALKGFRFSAVVFASLLLFVEGPFVSVAAAPAQEPITLPSQVALVETGDIESLVYRSTEVSYTFHAVVTQYSYLDSCHNIRNGKCLMASGKPVYVGAVACPYSLKLGTRLKVGEKIYTCEDRYAKWLDGRRGRPTIDVFVPSNPRGNGVQTISVLQ